MEYRGYKIDESSKRFTLDRFSDAELAEIDALVDISKLMFSRHGDFDVYTKEQFADAFGEAYNGKDGYEMDDGRIVMPIL